MNCNLSARTRDRLFRVFDCIYFIAEKACSDGTLFAIVVSNLIAKEESSGQEMS